MSEAGSASHLTTLLNQVGKERDAQDKLFRIIEQRFRAIAAKLMHQELPDHALQDTVLIDDAFGKLISDKSRWSNREQFFCAAAKVMRQLLISYARKRDATKRGGREAPASLARGGEIAGIANDPQRLVELADLVERLEKVHPESFKVFNLHYFMGWELKEIADEILEIPYTTVKRRWGMAKAFLHKELTGD